MYDPCALDAALGDPRLRLLPINRRWYFVGLCRHALGLGPGGLIPTDARLSAAQQLTVLAYSLNMQERALERALADWAALGLIERDGDGIYIPLLDTEDAADEQGDVAHHGADEQGPAANTARRRDLSTPRVQRLRARAHTSAHETQNGARETQSETHETAGETLAGSVSRNGGRNGTNVYTSPDSKSMKLTHDSGDVYTLPAPDETPGETPPKAPGAPPPAPLRPEFAGLSDDEIEAKLSPMDREVRKQMVGKVIQITGAPQYRPLWHKLWKHGYRYSLLERCWDGPDGMLAILGREMKAGAMPVANRGGFLSRTLVNLYRDAGAPVSEGTAEEREEAAAQIRQSLATAEAGVAYSSPDSSPVTSP